MVGGMYRSIPLGTLDLGLLAQTTDGRSHGDGGSSAVEGGWDMQVGILKRAAESRQTLGTGLFLQHPHTRTPATPSNPHSVPGSLQDVRSTSLDLLAGLALPDADGDALHGELCGRVEMRRGHMPMASVITTPESRQGRVQAAGTPAGPHLAAEGAEVLGVL